MWVAIIRMSTRRQPEDVGDGAIGSRALAQPDAILVLLADSSAAVALGYGTVALHAEVSPDSKPSTKTPHPLKT